MAKKSNSTTPTQNQKPQIGAPEKESADASRKSFEEQHTLFMNEFRAICEKENAPVAVAIVIPPKFNPKTDEPLIYGRGHLYDQAMLLAQVIRAMKEKIAANLDC